MKLQPIGKFDNAAKPYKHIEVTPHAAAMGAEIAGVDIARLTDAQAAEIKDALWRHKMIYFRDQRIGHGDQESFTLRFGEFGTDAYTTGMPGHPNIQPVVKEAETRVKMVFGEGWHTDSPFLARPPAVSILYSAEVPPWGGDTIWCNTALAYDYLSATMKAMLAPLRVHMSAIEVLKNIDAGNDAARQDAKRTNLGNMELDLERASMIAGSFHPLVRTHPETGTKALYVDETYAQAIDGMTEAESKALLRFLVAHVTQPSFQCRLRWANGMLVAWDNRSCIHHAFNDYDGYRRAMYRSTVLGEAPA
jgi:alpha-ketoglutarate-dependent taurine dioxygenase